MSRSTEIVDIFNQLTSTTVTSDTLMSSLQSLMQIWADARYLVRNTRPQSDTDFIGFIRNELFSRTLFVMEHTTKAQGLYHKQLANAERMATMERQGYISKEWLTAALGSEKLQYLSDEVSYQRTQSARRLTEGKVLVMKERINKVEEFLKLGLKDDFPAFREAGPLLVDYLTQCLALHKARLAYYEAEEFNRQKLIGWLDDDNST